MTREISLFERPTRLCYCAPNSAAQCAPCRERTARKRKQIDVVSIQPTQHPFQWLLDALPYPTEMCREDHHICWSNGQGGHCNNDCSVFLAGRCDAQYDGAEYFINSAEGRAWAMERIEEDADEEVYLSVRALIDDQRALDGDA